ncbi:hypothetical protein B0H34DRAFT_857025 [Crassisporium funariophilum]|nr:hypothetical protein B0H34DRAFT_857025 [Crassisporium funariophilum]
MLLKFTAPDMLNTSLVDVATGSRAYDIVTVLLPNPTSTELLASSSKSVSSPVFASSSRLSSSFGKRPVSPPVEESDATSTERRQTKITDATGNVVAEVIWKGRRPDITIGDEKIGALTDLFGSSTVRFMPKILAIPTRFDTEYIWTATPDSLTLFDYDAEAVRGTFHQNAIRIATPYKSHKFNLTSSPNRGLRSPSKPLLTASDLPSAFSSSSSIGTPVPEPKVLKPKFIPTHLPGLGSNYLEFASHPLAQDVEIILSFLMMEILRRGRFSLTPYTFERPKLWQLKEARDLFWRRLRRNTV